MSTEFGTTAQELASGRPQVLVPFAHDQPENARRVVQIGAGVAIPARRLNVARLVSALKNVTQSEMFSTRARDVAADLNRDGFEQRLLGAVSQFLTSGRVSMDKFTVY